MAARIAKDLRVPPEVFFCFQWLSALHLLAEKAGDRLRELALGFSGGGAAARGGKQYTAEHVALGEDGRGHGHGVALVGLGDRQRAGIGRILAARGHELLKLAADAPLEQLPLAAAGHGDDGVAVAHGGDRS